MAHYAKNCKASIIQGLRYRDAPAMIEWLGRAFGFETKAMYPGPGDTVMHAELTFGNGMIMIGSVGNATPSSELMMQPDELEGKETQSPYLVVSDCDAVYAAAKAAGAEMVLDLEDKGYGGKGFTCRDPEGHIWHVGTYDPWE